ncbi:MAG: hypothetical protein UT02_C0004G0012 [Parcubacteria group bacterium GW2011_GWC2_38_7]|nr:MAG: hypothetical protein UT02_C0004G0012 [Parcubacteria group bacterium GW2011_GWC2_38_7]
MKTALDQAYKFVTKLQTMNSEIRDQVDVSIVTVNWNVKEIITKMIQSIFLYTRNIRFEVIVVDNKSSDGSVEHLQQQFRDEINSKRLVIIDNDFNAGFAEANNQGLSIAKGEYVFFMNPDMEIHDNVVLKLKEFFQSKTNAGVVTCRLLYADKSIQPSVKRLPDLCSQILVMLKLHHFLSWLPCIKNYLMKDFDYLSEKEVQQAMGACIFTTKEILNKIGGWDETYWLWWEDVELCKNIVEHGYKIYFTPHTEITHYEGKSFAQTFGLKKQKRFNNGLLHYFKKHHKPYEYWILFCLQPISWLLTLLTQTLKIKARPQSRV